MLHPCVALLSALVPTAPQPQAPHLHFTEATGKAGLDVPLGPRPGGLAVGDFDADGWPDLIVSGALAPRPKFFRNRGAEIEAGAAVRWFENVSDEVMPYGGEPSSLSSLADMDGDGDLDLITVRRYVSSQYPDGNFYETGMIFDEWDGTRFRRVRTHPNLGRSHNRLGGMTVGDVDRDGDLDVVFLKNGGGVGEGGPGFYLRNDGLDRFLDATRIFGGELGTQRRHFQPVLADFNGDGHFDLHVAIDFQADYHCWGTASGRFHDVSAQVGTNNGGSDMGLAVGDIENDGDLDIFSTNIASGVLYVNDGQGNFVNEAGVRGVGAWGFDGSRTGWGTSFFDADNDGDQDLMFVSVPDGGHLFENDGSGHFVKKTREARVILEGVAGLTFDFDRDGDLDLIQMAKWPGRLVLYENDSPGLEGNHWLRVRLRGTTSNTEGVGAHIELEAGGQRQVRQILGSDSFNSSPPREAHFGLGQATQVDLLRVRWPSGARSVLRDLAVDRELVVVEP